VDETNPEDVPPDFIAGEPAASGANVAPNMRGEEKRLPRIDRGRFVVLHREHDLGP
jgi:hypothetical protein